MARVESFASYRSYDSFFFLFEFVLGLSPLGLFVPFEKAVLFGNFGGLDPVLGHRHQVLDGLLVVGPGRVILNGGDDGDGDGDDQSDVDLGRQATAVVAVVVPPHLFRMVQHVIVLNTGVVILQHFVAGNGQTGLFFAR